MVAGADAAQPAFRCRPEGPGCVEWVYEPLATWDPGRPILIPILAAEIPSEQNGGVGRNGPLSVTWKLKRNVKLA